MTEQVSLEAYQDELRDAARDAGDERSRVADPDGFAEAIAIIRRLADAGAVFTADDVRRYQRVGTPSVLGAAFRAARRARWIEVVGVTTALSTSSHGRLLRSWKAPP